MVINTSTINKPAACSTYFSRWLLPVSENPIENAYVRVENGIIRDYGRRSGYKDSPTGITIDLGESIIMPGMVNAHTHLELSALQGKVRGGKGFVDWVSHLAMRKYLTSKKNATRSAARAIDQIIASGTVALADVTNTGLAVPLLLSKGVYAAFFHELYSLNDGKAEEIYTKKERQIESYTHHLNISHHIIPHAPYSVSVALFEKIRDNAGIISVHLAESRDECELIANNRGRLRDLFISIGYLKRNWSAPGITPVEYLDTLGILNRNTIAVHAVYVSDGDINILKERGVSVCLCIRSNEFIGVGKPPVRKFLDSGVNLALGTDSLASNSDLSLLNEMRHLSSAYPEIERKDIVRMATLGGAEALGLDSKLGSISTGKESRLISIKTPGSDILDPYEAIFMSQEPLINQLDIQE